VYTNSKEEKAQTEGYVVKIECFPRKTQFQAVSKYEEGADVILPSSGVVATHVHMSSHISHR